MTRDKKTYTEKPRVIHNLKMDENKIVETTIKDVVRAFGKSSGYILLPKELIGQYVTVFYPSKNLEGRK